MHLSHVRSQDLWKDLVEILRRRGPVPITRGHSGMGFTERCTRGTGHTPPGPRPEGAIKYTILSSTTTYALYTYMYAKVGFNTIMYYIHTKESGSQPAIVSTYVRMSLSVP